MEIKHFRTKCPNPQEDKMIFLRLIQFLSAIAILPIVIYLYVPISTSTKNSMDQIAQLIFEMLKGVN